MGVFYFPFLEDCHVDDDGNYDSVYTTDNNPKNNRNDVKHDSSNVIEKPYYGKEDGSDNTPDNPEGATENIAGSEFTTFTRVDNIYYGEKS